MSTWKIELCVGGVILLVAELGAEFSGAQFPILYVENAHRTFFRILARFFSNEDPENRTAGISSTAVIESKHIGDNVFIGHHTYIGENAWLAPGTVVKNQAAVGQNSYLGLGAVVTKDVPPGKLAVGIPVKVVRDR